jgi:hypothetical protein
MTVIKTVVGVLILGQLVIATPAWAACQGASPNRTAVSANQIDVSDCLAAAVNGDTISVPAGSATWTSTFTITKFVKLIASGTVVITDNSAGGDPGAGGGPSLIAITESTAGNTKIQGFMFVQGSGVHLGAAGIIAMNIATNGKPILVTGNTFTQRSSGNSIVAHTNRGVIWGNTFTGVLVGGACLNDASAVRHKISNLTSSWTSASSYGTADTNGDQNLYFETNNVTNVFQAIDVDDNARTVVRFNTMTNASVVHHGTDTGGGNGGRYSEVYSNNFIYDQTPQATCGGLPANLTNLITLRGGTSLIHDNVIPALSSQAWGSKPGVGFKAENLHRATGTYPCYGVNQSLGSVYPFPRNPGWGYNTGGTQSGSTGVFMDREPIYLWNNTGGGNYDAPAVEDYVCSVGDSLACASSCPTPPYQRASDFIQPGREYFTATAKPGYTAYTYPHPLTGSSASATNVPAPTNVPATLNVPAPTNLKVQ